MKASPSAAVLLLVSACSSSSSPPFEDAGAETVQEDGGTAVDSSAPVDTGSPLDASSGAGLRCYVTASSCVCLDPAPEGYTATSCPAMPCCWSQTTSSPHECACAMFTGTDCDKWRSGTPVASCP